MNKFNMIAKEVSMAVSHTKIQKVWWSLETSQDAD